MNRRSIRTSAVLIWAALLVALALADWPLGLTNSWASAHQVFVAIGTSVLLLFAGAFAFDAWLKHRESRQWQRVATVAYRALSQEAKDTRVKLRLFVDGTDPRLEGASVDPDKVQRFHDLLSATDTVSKPLDEHVAALACRDQWLECVLASLRDMKREGWQTVTDWAPIMLSTGRLAVDLDALAVLNDQVIALQRTTANCLGRCRAGDEVDGQEVLSALQGVIRQSFVLEQHLRIGAGYERRNHAMEESATYWGVSLDDLDVDIERQER